jgi:hypothetical protein
MEFFTSCVGLEDSSQDPTILIWISSEAPCSCNGRDHEYFLNCVNFERSKYSGAVVAVFTMVEVHSSLFLIVSVF